VESDQTKRKSCKWKTGGYREQKKKNGKNFADSQRQGRTREFWGSEKKKKEINGGGGIRWTQYKRVVGEEQRKKR